jgi:hypothetical protein
LPSEALTEVDTLGPLPNDFAMRYLARREDVDTIVVRPVETCGDFVIDTGRSPIVEFSRSRFDLENNRLGRGRLYYRTGYLEGGVRVEFDPAFIAWADRLLNLVRRGKSFRKLTEPDLRGFSVSQRAEAWRNETGGQLAPF